jgi:hypothetical protein
VSSLNVGCHELVEMLIGLFDILVLCCCLLARQPFLVLSIRGDRYTCEPTALRLWGIVIICFFGTGSTSAATNIPSLGSVSGNFKIKTLMSAESGEPSHSLAWSVSSKSIRSPDRILPEISPHFKIKPISSPLILSCTILATPNQSSKTFLITRSQAPRNHGAQSQQT